MLKNVFRGTNAASASALSHLLHGREEALWVEEAGHPEGLRLTTEAPGVELGVTIDEFGEPEAQGARGPRYLRMAKVTFATS